MRNFAIADNSYVGNIRVMSYPLVLKFELEREVVFRPTFVLPFGCPKPPLKWSILSKNPDNVRDIYIWP